MDFEQDKISQLDAILKFFQKTVKLEHDVALTSSRLESLRREITFKQCGEVDRTTHAEDTADHGINPCYVMETITALQIQFQLLSAKSQQRKLNSPYKVI